MASVRVRVMTRYRHPKTGVFVSQDSKTKRLFTRDRAGRKRYLSVELERKAKRGKEQYEVLQVSKESPYKKVRGQFRQIARLARLEKILPVRTIQDRTVRKTFGSHRVFAKLWANQAGEIRVLVGGMIDGREAKTVLHIAYARQAWEEYKDGYEQFKNFLIHRILRELRRKRLRLSNGKESALRIARLKKRQGEMIRDLETPILMSADRQKQFAQSIKVVAGLIREQKRTRQMTQGYIRIEKLAP